MFKNPDIIFDFCKPEGSMAYSPNSNDPDDIYVPPFIPFLLKGFLLIIAIIIYSIVIDSHNNALDKSKWHIIAVLLTAAVLYKNSNKRDCGKTYVFDEKILTVKNGANFPFFSSVILLTITVVLLTVFVMLRLQWGYFSKSFPTECLLIISPLLYFNYNNSYEINFQTKKVYIDLGLFKLRFMDLGKFGGIDKAYSSPERSAFFYRLWLTSDRYVKCIPLSGIIESSNKYIDEAFINNVILKFKSEYPCKEFQLPMNLLKNKGLD